MVWSLKYLWLYCPRGITTYTLLSSNIRWLNGFAHEELEKYSLLLTDFQISLLLIGFFKRLHWCKFQLCLVSGLYFQKNFRMGLFLHLSTSRWGSFHSIPDFIVSKNAWEDGTDINCHVFFFESWHTNNNSPLSLSSSLLPLPLPLPPFSLLPFLPSFLLFNKYHWAPTIWQALKIQS